MYEAKQDSPAKTPTRFPAQTLAVAGKPLLIPSPLRNQQALLRLQRQYGNSYVQRLVERSRQGQDEAAATPEVEAGIEQARGQGQPLDHTVQRQMESAFGTDFGNVRVHTDSSADSLNQALSARAFTTGQDIFFRQGEYSPGSSGGKELLAHELTHVVQQTGGLQASRLQAKLAIGQPHDTYEQEADQVAHAVVQMIEPTAPQQAGDTRPALPATIQRACAECSQEEQPIGRELTRSLEETDEGTETLSTTSLKISSGIGGGQPAIARDSTATVTNTCALTGAFSSIPSGTLAATLRGNKLGAPFNMMGTFTPPVPCSCSGGEYRQYVRGTFSRNGASVTHALAGTNLHPTNYQEDGGIFGGTTYKYGYRSNPFATSNFTTPDQATGCRFEGSDYPGITGSSGATLGINLDFLGALIDTSNSNNVLASAAWSVVGSATVP